MSTIHEALKKAQGEAKERRVPASPFRRETSGAPRAIQVEFEKRKDGLNWGPLFVVLVLLLISGPIVAPLFSTPFKKSNPFLAMEAGQQRIPIAQNIPVEAATEIAGAIPEEKEATKKSQFAIEEMPLTPPSPFSPAPNFRLTGIVYSPKGSYCILNNQILKVGQNLESATLMNITPEEVVLDYRGERISLPVAT